VLVYVNSEVARDVDGVFYLVGFNWCLCEYCISFVSFISFVSSMAHVIGSLARC
jgi:hypothetical protein